MSGDNENIGGLRAEWGPEEIERGGDQPHKDVAPDFHKTKAGRPHQTGADHGPEGPECMCNLAETQTTNQVLEFIKEARLTFAITIDLKDWFHNLGMHRSDQRWMRIQHNGQA